MHRDTAQNSQLATLLIEENTEIYYMPPRSPEFNPIEPMFERIRERLLIRVRKGEVKDYESMW